MRRAGFDPFDGITRANSSPNLQSTRPSRQRFPRSAIVTRPQFDHMPTEQLVYTVALSKRSSAIRTDKVFPASPLIIEAPANNLLHLTLMQIDTRPELSLPLFIHNSQLTRKGPTLATEHLKQFIHFKQPAWI